MTFYEKVPPLSDQITDPPIGSLKNLFSELVNEKAPWYWTLKHSEAYQG